MEIEVLEEGGGGGGVTKSRKGEGFSPTFILNCSSRTTATSLVRITYRRSSVFGTCASRCFLTVSLGDNRDELLHGLLPAVVVALESGAVAACGGVDFLSVWESDLHLGICAQVASIMFGH